MNVIETSGALREALRGAEAIGFVPTMGNLHDGHIDLTRIARERVGRAPVVVSIFVNRLQFGVNEDFDKYPRTFADDCARCEAAGVDVVFAPTEREMYPRPQTYTVVPDAIENVLEGAIRPGHFRGVATVVAKLFNMVRPSVAVFGKKDYQQCRVIANMVEQLNMPTALVFAETVRATDGLALSSRNGYLSAAERAEAPQLHAALSRLRDKVRSGRRDFASMCASEVDALRARSWQPDYIEIRRRTDLGIPSNEDDGLVALAAAKLGSTRLIDNLEI